jgi:hypothetical protein
MFTLLPRIAGAGLAFAALTASFARAAADGDKRPIPIPCEAVDSVGRATMASDGTITLVIRKMWPTAESTLSYAPNDARHDEITRHLGGIAPGQTKPIPPLCGTNSEP